MAGEIAPGWRMGTLEGEDCSTVAIGVLVEGMVRMSPNGCAIKVIAWGVGNACKFTHMCRIGGDSGPDSLSR